MALRRVAASSCGSLLRGKLGFLGAVSNHQNHLLFPPQLSRQFRRHLFCNLETGELLPDDFTVNADKRCRPSIRIGMENIYDLKDPKVVKAAEFAVKEYNEQKNANLQFVRVVKASVVPSCGLMYYITVEAIDCGEKKTYKTRVLLDASKRCILVLRKFELEPSNQGNNQAGEERTKTKWWGYIYLWRV